MLQIDFVLGTINAPRSVPLDEEGLLRCLHAPEPDPRCYPDIEALFDEVSAEALHDVVLAGIVTFDDLRRAEQTWHVTHGRLFPWVTEMSESSKIRSRNL